MSRYIDADKLIPEIERYEKTAIDAYNPIGEDADFWHGKVVACEDLKTLVTSFQQESTPSKEEVVDRIADWISHNPDFFFNGDTKEVMNEIKKLV